MPPDRALRRVVIDLAVLPEDDRAAILELLEPGQRRRVIGLLLEYTGTPHSARAAKTQIDMSPLSPWLADRVLSGKSMTLHASALLHRCAADMLPHDRDRKPDPRFSLLGRFGSPIRGGRAAA